MPWRVRTPLANAFFPGKVHGSMKRRAVLAGSLGVLSSGLLSGAALTGCQASAPPLRVALNAWIGYALLFLARELGHLRESTARLVEFPSNTASLLAMANHGVSVAALTLDELLLARDGGLNLKAVLVFDESHGADVVMVHPSIHRVTALKGKRIGVESTAVGALMLSRLLEAAGLAATDLVKVTLTADQHVQAYAAGEVDAVITFEPMASQLRAAGARPLLDSSHFPGLIVDVLAIGAEVGAQGESHLRDLIRAYFLALSHLKTQPDDAARRLAPYQQLGTADVLEAFRGIHLPDPTENRLWLTGRDAQLCRSADTVGRLMHEARLLRTRPSLEGLCTAEFLPEAS